MESKGDVVDNSSVLPSNGNQKMPEADEIDSSWTDLTDAQIMADIKELAAVSHNRMRKNSAFQNDSSGHVDFITIHDELVDISKQFNANRRDFKLMVQRLEQQQQRQQHLAGTQSLQRREVETPSPLPPTFG